MSEINLLRVAIIGTQKKFYALTTPFWSWKCKEFLSKTPIQTKREKPHPNQSRDLQTNFIEAVFPDFAIIIRHQDQKISGHDKTLRGANHASRVIHDKNV